MRFRFGDEVGGIDRAVVEQILRKYPDHYLCEVYNPRPRFYSIWIKRGAHGYLILCRDGLDEGVLEREMRRAMNSIRISQLQRPTLPAENDRDITPDEFLSMREEDLLKTYPGQREKVERMITELRKGMM